MNQPIVGMDLLDKDCLVEDVRWSRIDDVQAFVEKVINQAHHYVLVHEDVAILEGSEVSLVFADNESVQELNAVHRDKDKPTNVLSFPIDEDADPLGPLLGDIIFAYETVEHEADEIGVAFEDHLTHLCIHGFLHLLGYDHIVPDEAEKMEAVEIAILAEMQINNPYSGSDPIEMPD